mmetsp:Transcript_15261/g.20973  ORF Transcript_15261/g.20973 Transcript_15261/m.20973 type:complete len:80 (-) Transcript_15261:1665-1904(-)
MMGGSNLITMKSWQICINSGGLRGSRLLDKWTGPSKHNSPSTQHPFVKNLNLLKGLRLLAVLKSIDWLVNSETSLVCRC